MFNQTLCTLQYKLSNFNMILWKFIEGGCDNLALNRALHIGNFLRTLINQEYKKLYLGMIR
ncbi:hypothetical protein D3C71_2016210 [compost metagenome]